MNGLGEDAPVSADSPQPSPAGDREVLTGVIKEATVPCLSRHMLESGLRLLARWLVSAARKGAPVADSSPIEASQNPLDVARDTEVVSKA